MGLAIETDRDGVTKSILKTITLWWIQHALSHLELRTVSVAPSLVCQNAHHLYGTINYTGKGCLIQNVWASHFACAWRLCLMMIQCSSLSRALTIQLFAVQLFHSPFNKELNNYELNNTKKWMMRTRLYALWCLHLTGVDVPGHSN